MAVTLTEPDTAKAAVLSTDMVHMSVPIEKAEDTEAINPVDGTPDVVITGKATDGTLDSDLQVVDPEASLKWIKTWFDTKANIRMGHDPKRPVGRGLNVDGHRIQALIADPVAKHLIRTRVLNDFSVGIMHPDVRVGDPRFKHLDPMGKAVNGVITDRSDGLTQLGEISVVDRGSNYGSSFQLMKAAADGTPEWVGKMVGPDGALTKSAGGNTVTLELPEDVSMSFSPADMAKLMQHRRLAEQREMAKAAVPQITKDKLSADDRHALSDSDYAYIDSKGGRHLPINDESHVRAAMARFNQQQFESDSAKRKAAKKILAAAKKYGIDVSGDDNVAQYASKAAKPAAAKAMGKKAKKKARRQADLQENSGDGKETVPAASEKGAKPPKTKAGKKANGKKKGKRNLPPAFVAHEGHLHDGEKAAKTAKKARKGGKLRGGVVGTAAHEMKPVPPHREPDGAEVEAYEADLRVNDGDNEAPTKLEAPTLGSEAEKAALLRFKACGVEDTDLGVLHDLTCAAYHPDEVAKYHPSTDLAAVIDEEHWQRKALQAAASLPLDQAMRIGAIAQAARTLKGADARDIAAYRVKLHKAFRDANPGPTSFPTPGEISPQKFCRPYISAGHAAPSPGHDGPNTAPVPSSDITAAQATRGPLTAGHEAPSPANKGLVDYPSQTGKPTLVDYAHAEKENARQAFRAMHDHVAQTFPDVCPMTLSPTPREASHPVPHTEGVSKGARRKAAKAEKRAASQARKAAKAKRARLEKKLQARVLKGKLSVDEARERLGRKPFGAPETSVRGQVTKAATAPAPPAPDIIKAAVADAIAEQDERHAAEMKGVRKVLKKQAKMLDALADQPDPAVAGYRGVALTKSSARPAAPQTVAETAERSQVMQMQRLREQWLTDPDPRHREDAEAALFKMAGLTR